MGPRSGLMLVSGEHLVTSLAKKKGSVAFTREKSRDFLQEVCGARHVVLGSREATGLEFPGVGIDLYHTGCHTESRYLSSSR